MGLSDTIAALIEKLIEEGNGNAEIKRNDLAGQLGCVPSQINYVITSRFTPERGYIIESRRGGGGYIRITRKAIHRDEYLMHMFAAAGPSLDEASAEVFTADLLHGDFLTQREAKLFVTALRAISDDGERAALFRQLLLVIL